MSEEAGMVHGPATSLRQPVEEDLEGIEAMWTRCSTGSRLGRFHSPVRVIPASYLREVIRRPEESLVAVSTRGPVSTSALCAIRPIVAVASLLRTGDGYAELAVLVEDAYQGRGLGRSLVAELVAGALEAGVGRLVSVVLADNARALRLLRGIPGGRTVSRDGPEITTIVTLARPDSRRLHRLTVCGKAWSGPI